MCIATDRAHALASLFLLDNNDDADEEEEEEDEDDDDDDDDGKPEKQMWGFSEP
jgi:hypothetical protein